MIEQLFIHESPIRVRRIAGHRIIFIEVECDDVREIQAVFAVEFDEFRMSFSMIKAAWREAWVLDSKTSVGMRAFGTY
jgi:hypothetical protein